MKNLVFILMTAWLAVLGTDAFSADAGAPAAMPNVLLKIAEALEASKIDELTSHVGDGGTTYHLCDLSYLGTVKRDHETFTVAKAFYRRSSPPDRDTPPARGHSFIMILSPKFKVVSYARCEVNQYFMQGDCLMDGARVITDFQKTEPSIRYHGFFIEGVYLPYPFADRISEAEWESGAFMKDKPKAK